MTLPTANYWLCTDHTGKTYIFTCRPEDVSKWATIIPLYAAAQMSEQEKKVKVLRDALGPFVDFPKDTLDSLEELPNQRFTMTVFGFNMSAAIAATGENK